MSEIVDDLKRKACKDAEDSRCCLKCRFSYFQPFADEGMCHNENIVRGMIFPRIVGDLDTCSYFQKKQK